MVVVVCGEGYTKSQQGKFINDVKRLWQDAMKYEPYRSYADRFNVYALCTASESTFDNGGSTFFDVIVDKYNSPVISNNLHGSQWKIIFLRDVSVLNLSRKFTMLISKKV